MLDALVFSFSLFFFNDTATTAIYTLSLHDALPIWPLTVLSLFIVAAAARKICRCGMLRARQRAIADAIAIDRKSTRLNSSHTVISYAVFCLKKKKTQQIIHD